MRLSEERIGAIAEKIAHELYKKRYVKTRKRLYQVTTWVEKPILDHFGGEETIDELVRADLARMTTCPPVGSFEYEALFEQRKQEMARRRNYSL